MNKHRTRCFCQQRNPNEVKNRKEFFGEEIRNDSKIRWKIVANAASLKRYEWFLETSAFPLCFRAIYEQRLSVDRANERVIERVVPRRENRENGNIGTGETRKW